MPAFPQGLDTNDNYQILGKFGFNDSANKKQIESAVRKKGDIVQVLKTKYGNNKEVTLMINPLDELGDSSGFAITKEGLIGLTPASDQYVASFESTGISKFEPYFTKKNNSMNSVGDIYKNEKKLLEEWIKLLPDRECDKKKLKKAVDKIDQLSKNHMEDATKALIYTRQFLSQPEKSQEKTTSILKKWMA